MSPITVDLDEHNLIVFRIDIPNGFIKVTLPEEFLKPLISELTSIYELLHYYDLP
jgi:hypothetical protein